MRLLQQLLRFRTVSFEEAKGAHAACVLFMQKECNALGLSTEVVSFVPNKPILLATRRGTHPELESVLFVAHVDVAPALDSHWGCDPFLGVVQHNAVWGRGAQDMKSTCAQYLLALLALKNTPLQRTVHLVFVPDEKIGGNFGTFLASCLASSPGQFRCPISAGVAICFDIKSSAQVKCLCSLCFCCFCCFLVAAMCLAPASRNPKVSDEPGVRQARHHRHCSGSRSAVERHRLPRVSRGTCSFVSFVRLMVACLRRCVVGPQ